MKKKKIIIINLIFTLLLILCHPIFMMNIDASEEAKLTQVVVLSRHNIRAPLSTKGSILDEATPHTWFSWSSEASELSSKGGMLETAMGQYFRKYLESEGLLPSNYQPKDDSIRFYANSMQRTIATANYFRSGFLPVGDIQVETKTEFNTMDPTFHPQFTYLTEDYIKEAEQQMRNLIPDLSEEYALLTDVLDMHDSTAYQNKKIEDFKNDDNTFSFEVNKEPTIKGSLKSATSLADALVLQYYEDPDAKKAAFDHSLT
ncbi:MAG: histidine-type phosphatase, partial [Solobacterium sp.]|nr:histidine-type phosphatase [Solobacterium sp.]